MIQGNTCAVSACEESMRRTYGAGNPSPCTSQSSNTTKRQLLAPPCADSHDIISNARVQRPRSCEAIGVAPTTRPDSMPASSRRCVTAAREHSISRLHEMYQKCIRNESEMYQKCIRNVSEMYQKSVYQICIRNHGVRNVSEMRLFGNSCVKSPCRRQDNVSICGGNDAAQLLHQGLEHLREGNEREGFECL